MPNALIRPLPLVALAAALAACTMTTDESPGLANTAWRLAILGGSTVAASPAVTLNFTGGQVQGTDGCNRYSGPYSGGTTAAGELRVPDRLAATQMACPPPVMDQARRYLEALSATRTFRVANGQLELLDADGRVAAGFAPVPRSLAGTRWQVTSYNNGRQAVVSTLAGTSVTVSFGSDGRIAGTAGCNSYTGTFEDRQTGIRIGPLAATRKMCVRPEGVMEQEAAFLTALESAATARREGDRLELGDAGGALLAQLVTDLQAE